VEEAVKTAEIVLSTDEISALETAADQSGVYEVLY